MSNCECEEVCVLEEEGIWSVRLIIHYLIIIARQSYAHNINFLVNYSSQLDYNIKPFLK